MGELLEVVTPLHTRTSRDYLARMTDDKVHCMRVAREYEREYWDGDRRYGYGGYTYDGRWKPVAQKLIDRYGLEGECRILDVGCGKAHLLYELSQFLPGSAITGFDVSAHGIADAPSGIRNDLRIHRAQDEYPFEDNHFDLVISLGCLHNLRIFEVEAALGEIERVGRQGYVMLESYRNDLELFNLQCWALTCESFFSSSEWEWLYKRFGYTGDFEFIYFE